MSKIISWGKVNHFYKNILLLYPDKGQLYFSKHKYVHMIFCYFFIFILGMIYNIADEYETQSISIISNKIQDKNIESH